MFIVYAVVILPTFFIFNPYGVITNGHGNGVEIMTFSPPNMTVFTVIAFIFAILSSTMVYNYRFNKKKVDIYYQLPLKEKEFRNTKILTSLAIQIIMLTFFFLLAILILFIKQQSCLTALKSQYQDYDFSSLKAYNYGSLFIFYLMILLFTICLFFISCFIVSLTNNIFSAYFYLILIFAILGTAYPVMTVYKYSYDSLHISQHLYSTFNLTPNPIGMGNCIYDLDIYIQSGLEDDDWPNLIRIIITTVETICFGSLSAVHCFISKDTSGENAGSNKDRYKVTYFIPHILFFITSLYLFTIINSLGMFTLSILILPLYIVVYFIILGLIRRGLKFKWMDYACTISIFVITCLLSLIPLLQ